MTRTIAAFQEEFSFKFLPETRLVRDIKRVSDRWSTRRKGTRANSYCSRPRYGQFQMRH